MHNHDVVWKRNSVTVQCATVRECQNVKCRSAFLCRYEQVIICVRNFVLKFKVVAQIGFTFLPHQVDYTRFCFLMCATLSLCLIKNKCMNQCINYCLWIVVCMQPVIHGLCNSRDNWPLQCNMPQFVTEAKRWIEERNFDAIINSPLYYENATHQLRNVIKTQK